VEYRLTPAGEALLPVAGVLGAWLEEAPGAARPLGGAEAKAAVGALSEGWSAMLLRPLAARSLSLAELDELIARLNYPALERRIAAMRDAGQVEALPARGRETPYAVTPWLRRAAAPLLAAIAWEREHLADAPRTGRIDFEALLLLAVPLLRIDPAATGSCRIAVELPAGGNSEPAVAGLRIDLREGTVTSCSSRLNGEQAGAWASGSDAAWLRALAEAEPGELELSGDRPLARLVAGGLHRALFDPPRSHLAPGDRRAE
jgi:DNA-binding HxlR family transcriptional regulator